MKTQIVFRLSLLAVTAAFAAGFAPNATASGPAKMHGGIAAASAGPAGLVTLERDLYARAYHSFLTNIRAAHPEFKLGETAFYPPPFNADVGRNAWLRQFPAWTLAQRQNELANDPAALAALPSVAAIQEQADEIFSSYYQNERYAHFSAIETVQPERVAPGQSVLKSRAAIALPSAWPTDHTLDLRSYVSQRFPVELQEFVMTSGAPLILDDSSCAAAYSLQKAYGYTHATKFVGDHDSPDSQFMILYNDAKPAKFQFLVCQIRGHDDQARMVEMVGPIFKNNGAEIIHHLQPEPLSRLNSQGLALKIDAQDLVVIGYQNSVWWKVSDAEKNKNWERHLLTSAGAELDIFANKQTGKRIISVANVYGDEMLQALNLLWKKGARRFIYVGTAGALDPQLNIGDVLLPTSFQMTNGRWFDFKNDALTHALVAPTPSKVFAATKHGWAATLIDETKPHIYALREAGVQAIDVEAKYFAGFLKDKPCEKMVIITVSDTPLGKITFDQETIMRKYPIRSAELIIEQLLRDEQ